MISRLPSLYSKALVLSIFIFCGALPLQAHAQFSASTNSYLGVYTGDLLPSEFAGVTEIMPLVGATFGIPQQNSWIEIGIWDANAKGTTFCNLSASLKVNVPLQGLYGILLFGVDYNYFETPNAGSYTSAGGGHIGAGLGAPITDALHFRSEMRFNANPGVNMSITVGLELQL